MFKVRERNRLFKCECKSQWLASGLHKVTICSLLCALETDLQQWPETLACKSLAKVLEVCLKGASGELGIVLCMLIGFK